MRRIVPRMPDTFVTGVDFVACRPGPRGRAPSSTARPSACPASRPRAGCPACEFQAGNLTLAVIQFAAIGLDSPSARDGRAGRSPTSTPPGPSSNRAAWPSSTAYSTRGCATTPSSRTPTATRSSCTTATRRRTRLRRASTRRREYGPVPSRVGLSTPRSTKRLRQLGREVVGPEIECWDGNEHWSEGGAAAGLLIPQVSGRAPHRPDRSFVVGHARVADDRERS